MTQSGHGLLANLVELYHAVPIEVVQRRREFITLLGGVAAARATSEHAQQAVKLYRISILSPERPPPDFLEIFRQGLRELGYVEGQNVAFEIRSTEGYGQGLAVLANQLVALKVDVIVAINTPSVQAAKKASETIPIVMTRVNPKIRGDALSGCRCAVQGICGGRGTSGLWTEPLGHVPAVRLLYGSYLEGR